MRRKYVALTLGLVMTGMLLGGCGNSKDTGSTADIASSKDAAASSSPSTDQKSFDKKDENTVYGKITKADGNTITYEVLERQDNGAMPQGSKAPVALPSRKAHHRHKRTIAIQTVIRSQRARHRQNRKEVPIHRQVEHLREKMTKAKVVLAAPERHRHLQYQMTQQSKLLR